MKTIFSSEEVKIPKGVKVKLVGRQVSVTGPRGTLTKSFDHIKVDLKFADNGKLVRAEQWFASRQSKACNRTIITHINNMFTGVTKGFLYKMKLVYSHFPIAVEKNDKNEVEIKNYIGEKYTRKVILPADVTFDRPKDVKDEIVLTGNDIESVSKVAADLHGKARVCDKDIRKFLDGIYVSHRGHVVSDD